MVDSTFYIDGHYLIFKGMSHNKDVCQIYLKSVSESDDEEGQYLGVAFFSKLSKDIIEKFPNTVTAKTKIYKGISVFILYILSDPHAFLFIEPIEDGCFNLVWEDKNNCLHRLVTFDNTDVKRMINALPAIGQTL